MATGAAWTAQVQAQASRAGPASGSGCSRGSAGCCPALRQLCVQLSQKNDVVETLKRFGKHLGGKFEATKCAFLVKTFKMHHRILAEPLG